MQSTNTASWAATGGKRGNGFAYQRHMLLGADLDSTNYNLRLKFPTTFQFVASSTDTMLTLNHDYNGTALSIDSEATDATVVSVNMDAATSAKGIHVLSDSSNTGAFMLVHAKIDNTAATGAIAVVAENDSTGPCIQALSNAAGAVGAVVELKQVSASVANGDVGGRIQFICDDDGATSRTIMQMDARMQTVAAGSFESKLDITLTDSAASNLAITVDGDGQIHADLGAGSGAITVFDDEDDIYIAQLLEVGVESQTMFLSEMERIGVVTRKTPEQGGSGWMWSMQKADLFQLGCIGQIHDLMQDRDVEYREMFAGMEAEIARLNAGTTTVLTEGV